MPRIPGLNAFGNDVAPVVPSAPGARVVPAAYDRSRGIAEVGAGFQSAADTIDRTQQAEAARLEREAEKIKAEQDRAARVEEVTRAKRDQVALEERAAAERQRLLDDASVPNEAKAEKLNEWVTAERGKLESTYKIPDVLGGQQVAIDELRVRQTAELAAGIKTRNQEQTRANVAGTLESLGRQAAQASDPAPYIDQAIEHVTAAGAAAGWGADDVARINMETAESWSSAAVGRRILDDPAGALEDMKAGKYPHLTPEATTALEARAQGEIEQRMNRARIEGEARLARAGRAVERLDWFYSRGMNPPPALVSAAATLAKGTEYEAEMIAQQGDAVERVAFASRPLKEQAAAIEADKARAIDPAQGIDERDARALIWKEQQHATIANDVQQNGALDAAQAAGIIKLSPLDFADPASLPEQIAERNEQAAIAQTWAGVPAAPLTKAEIKGVSDALDQGTAKDRLRLLSGLSKSITDPVSFRMTMGELAKGRSVLATAGNHMQDGNSRAAELMVTGETLLRPPEAGGGKAPPMPSDKMLRADFDSSTAGMFEGNAADRDRLWQSARAVYAGLSQETGMYSVEVNGDQWKQAIDIAAGGLVNLDTWHSSGRVVIKPPRMSAESFQDAVRGVTPQQVIAQGGVAGYEPAEVAEAIRDGGLVNYQDGYAIRDGAHYLMRADGSGPFVWRPGDTMKRKP
jgi:hypothetical protein